MIADDARDLHARLLAIPSLQLSSLEMRTDSMHAALAAPADFLACVVFTWRSGAAAYSSTDPSRFVLDR